MIRYFTLALLFMLPGCGSREPEQMTLYSIDGTKEQERRVAEGIPVDPDHAFRGYPVLGAVEITDPAERLKLMAALKEGMAGKDLSPAGCFWPRHGLHVVTNGRAVDYVICFQCYQYDKYVGEKRLHGLIGPAVKPTFDEPLTAAKIPLAP